MRQLILDLRGNPGGLLDQAIDVASEFLPRGQVVVSVKGRTEYSEPIVYKSTGSDPATVPLVVLINRNSASASEIVAGAIQDHGRGLIVGETSFGKGLGAAHIPVAVQYRTDADDGALLHAVRTLVATRLFERFALRLLHAPRSDREPEPADRRNEQSQSRIAVSAGFTNSASTHWTGSENCGRPSFLRRRRHHSGYRSQGSSQTRPRDCESPKLRFTLRDNWLPESFPGWSLIKLRKCSTARTPRPLTFPITDRVVEAFRNFVRTQPDFQVQPAQIDEELEFAKLRLRQEIVTAAFSNDAGARVLLDSDAQVLRALEALPDAKRLADSTRGTIWRG